MYFAVMVWHNAIGRINLINFTPHLTQNLRHLNEILPSSLGFVLSN